MESPLAWDNLKVKVAQLYLTLCDPVDCSLLGSSVHGILQARILEGVVFPFSRGFSQPGLEPTSPTLLADSSLSEPPGKPNNTEVGSLSILEEIFLTQESNRGLLHCRQILYQLSYLYSATNILRDLGQVTVLLCVSVPCALVES